VLLASNCPSIAKFVLLKLKILNGVRELVLRKGSCPPHCPGGGDEIEGAVEPVWNVVLVLESAVLSLVDGPFTETRDVRRKVQGRPAGLGRECEGKFAASVLLQKRKCMWPYERTLFRTL
jgi:hypothetical protein